MNLDLSARHIWRHAIPLVAAVFLVGGGGCSGSDGGGSDPSPTIVAFTAAQSPITAGSGTTLSHIFTGGTGSIDHGIGSVVNGQTTEVTPAATTTYTLTVTDTAGTAVTQSVTVTVVAVAVIVSFSATPATIAPGASATLNAVFQNGVGTVDQNVGTITSGAGVDTGALAATRTYTLTVTNPASDNVTATASVIVTRFSPSGSMGVARMGHTATLLTNGKVLIAGGYSATPFSCPCAFLSSAELYDPATGTFGPTGTMGTARGSHTATLLTNGKVLIAGGYGESGPGFGIETIPSAELYDPTTETFTSTGSMITARAGTATLLQDGRVLFVGGAGNESAPNATAELYDPSTGLFTLTGSMTDGRSRWAHTATLLPSGEVLVAGGYEGSSRSTTTASSELYDSTAGTFSPTGQMGTLRLDHTATLLANGMVLIAGAYFPPGSPSSAELYDPSIGAFVATGQMSTLSTETSFPAGLKPTTATLRSDGQVLVTGLPVPSPVFISEPELFDPSAETFALPGPMRTARLFHTATLLQNGKVLIVGGRGFPDVPLASSEVFE